MSETMPLAFRLTWSDWTGHVEGRNRQLRGGKRRAPPPAVLTEDFCSLAEARARAAEMKAAKGDGLVLSITPVYAPRPKRLAGPLFDLPVMTKRLTP